MSDVAKHDSELQAGIERITNRALAWISPRPGPEVIYYVSEVDRRRGLGGTRMLLPAQAMFELEPLLMLICRDRLPGWVNASVEGICDSKAVIDICFGSWADSVDEIYFRALGPSVELEFSDKFVSRENVALIEIADLDFDWKIGLGVFDEMGEGPDATYLIALRLMHGWRIEPEAWQHLISLILSDPGGHVRCIEGMSSLQNTIIPIEFWMSLLYEDNSTVRRSAYFGISDFINKDNILFIVRFLEAALHRDPEVNIRTLVKNVKRRLRRINEEHEQMFMNVDKPKQDD